MHARGAAGDATSRRRQPELVSQSSQKLDERALWLHEVKAVALQSSYLVLTHPLDYARTLIQLGYEPFSPTERRGFLFKGSYLSLPNIFEYLKYIKNVDGFGGCYRGLGARLCQSVVANTVYRRVARQSPFIDDRPAQGDQPYPQQYQFSGTRSGAFIRDTFAGLNDDFVIAVKKTSWDIVCATSSAVASHPFYVVAVRSMGQFVGRETTYKSVFQAIKAIYDKEGIAGFFVGLVPRVVADVVYIAISASLIYVASAYLDKQSGMESVTTMGSNLVASSMTYQFHVVASVMAVNGSGLAIGDYPFTLKYDGWYECWKDLVQKRQVKRGSSIIGRTFVGHTVIINGTKRPSGFYFGPLHPPGLGMRDQILDSVFLMTRPKTD